MSDSDRGALGAHLKEMREYRGFSQEQVAKYLGVPRSAVSLIETGERRIDALELTKLAKLFQCTMDELTSPAKESPADVSMVARAAAELSEEDRAEVLNFARFLRSRKSGGSQ